MINTFLIIAWRNMLRNKRRSLITISGISFGLGAMIFLWGYIDGAHVQMKENFTGLLMGHIQIHGKGFEKTMSLNEYIEDPQPIDSILNTCKGILYTKRVRTFCLFATAENSVGGLLAGIDPSSERKVTKISKTALKGKFLEPRDSGVMALGCSLAESLKVSVGDKVIVMAQAMDGTLAGEAFRVKGLIKTGVEEIDKSMAFVTLQDTQKLLSIGTGVTDFVLRVSSFDDVNFWANQLKMQIPDNFEVMTWAEISPILKQWIDFDNAFAYVFLLIVLIIVTAGILNTILMSFLERKREFGIMISLGTKGYQLAITVGIESFLLGLLGVMGGMGLGMSATLIFSYVGIPISSRVKEAMASFFMSDVIYPVLNTEHILTTSLVVLISSLVVSIYPAWKASRLEPVETLYHL